jgi:ribosomal protein S18 acetylase RimI-like enzyme
MLATRPATPEDARPIAEVHVASWHAAYRGIVPDTVLATQTTERQHAFWQRALAEYGAAGRGVLVAHPTVDDDRAAIEGWVSYGPRRGTGHAPRDAELYAFYAHPSRFGSGIGRLLWDAARRDLVARGFDSVSVRVLEANARGRRFYERAGFAPVPDSQSAFTWGGATLRDLCYLIAIGPQTDTTPSPQETPA